MEGWPCDDGSCTEEESCCQVESRVERFLCEGADVLNRFFGIPIRVCSNVCVARTHLSVGGDRSV